MIYHLTSMNPFFFRILNLLLEDPDRAEPAASIGVTAAAPCKGGKYHRSSPDW